MAVNPARFGFSAEYCGDRRVYDGFDEYVRVEFPKRHPEEILPKPITKVWHWRP